MKPERPIRSIKTVVSSIDDQGDVRLLSLRDPDDWELPPATPGAHIDLYLGNGMTRAYSLCGDPADTAQYTVAVKKKQDGRGGSRYVHDAVRPGDVIDVSLPRNTFPALRPDQTYIFVAGGIGITPFVPMMHQLDRINGRYQLHLFYRDEAPLQDVLARLGQRGDIVLHDRASDRTPIQSVLPGVNDDTTAFCCGPLGMITDFDLAVQDWDPSKVCKEFFVAPEHAAAEKAYTLVLKKSDLSIDVPVGTTALQALHDAGIPVQSSCEGGICGACKVAWLEGEPVHQDLCLGEADRSQYFMPCVSSCKSQTLVLDL